LLCLRRLKTQIKSFPRRRHQDLERDDKQRKLKLVDGEERRSCCRRMEGEFGGPSWIWPSHWRGDAVTRDKGCVGQPGCCCWALSPPAPAIHNRPSRASLKPRPPHSGPDWGLLSPLPARPWGRSKREVTVGGRQAPLSMIFVNGSLRVSTSRANVACRPRFGPSSRRGRVGTFTYSGTNRLRSDWMTTSLQTTVERSE
jgi:hypothetical protein